MADHEDRVRGSHSTYLHLKMLHPLRVDIVGRLVEQDDIDRRLKTGPNLHELKLSPAQAIQALSHQWGDPIWEPSHIGTRESEQLTA